MIWYKKKSRDFLEDIIDKIEQYTSNINNHPLSLDNLRKIDTNYISPETKTVLQKFMYNITTPTPQKN